MKPLLITLSGPTCSGKTTLEKYMTLTKKYSRIRSFTTRAPRIGEVSGVDYDFITHAQFEELQEKDLIVQKVFLNGYWYGTTVPNVKDVVDSGKIPVVVVEPLSVQQFRNAGEKFGFQVVPILVTADREALALRYFERVLNEWKTTDKLSELTATRLLNMANIECATWHQLEKYWMILDSSAPMAREDVLCREIDILVIRILNGQHPNLDPK